MTKAKAPHTPPAPAPEPPSSTRRSLGAVVRAAASGGSRRRGDSWSRFVRWMRLALPLAAFAIVAVLVVWPEMEGPRPFESADSDRASRNEVVEPRFESRDEERQPYTVTAANAIQDSENMNLVRLEKPVADMTLKTGKWLAGNADTGLFDQSLRILVLDGRVRLYHDDGYEISAGKIEIDLKNRTIRSEAPVRGHGPAGTVEASGFFAEQDGGRLVFKGPARLVLNRALPGL